MKEKVDYVDYRVSPALKTDAVKEQYSILRKRIGIFGRAAMAEVIILIAVGLGPFLISSDTYALRQIARVYLGQSWINGFLGIILLLLYMGIRRQNSLCGLGTLVTGAAAMLYSPLLRVAYAQSDLMPGSVGWSRIPAYIFVLLYLLPFSILVYQYPSFVRMRKLKERYEERLNDRIDGVFDENQRKPGLMMVIWLLLLTAGVGVFAKDWMDYNQAMDLSSWERYTIPGTEVSMNLPVDNIREEESDNMYMASVSGDRFMVNFYCINDLETEAEDGEKIDGKASDEKEPDDRESVGRKPDSEKSDGEKSDGKTPGEERSDDSELRESADEVQILSEPVTGLINGTEYRQTAERQTLPGTTMDIHTRTFEVNGRWYACSVMVLGRTDSRMQETVDAILNSVRIGP